MSTEARSDERREDRYADIIIEGWQDYELPHATARRIMAVADAEQAELHAELENQRQSARTAWDVHAEHVETSNVRLLHWQGVADDEKDRAESAEAEVARLTTLLEQRTAALTRTIDAKNTAEAKVAEVERIAQAWADQPTDYDEDTEQQIADGLEILAVIHGHYSAECSCTACRAITRDAHAGDQP